MHNPHTHVVSPTLLMLYAYWRLGIGARLIKNSEPSLQWLRLVFSGTIFPRMLEAIPA